MKKMALLILSVLAVSNISKAEQYDKVLCAGGVNVKYICTDSTYMFYRKVILIGHLGNRCYLSLETGPITQDDEAQTFHSYGIASALNQESTPVSIWYYPVGYEQTEFAGATIEGFEQDDRFVRAELKVAEVKQCASLEEAGYQPKKN